jgi:hypothetical protein
MVSKSRRSWNWVWFFAVLAFLGLSAVGINAVYNMRQQLTPEALEQARKLWEKNGPADYDLEYTKTLALGPDTTSTEKLIVKVRNRKTIAVEGNVFIDEGRDKELFYSRYGMDALFDDIETFLKEDARPQSPRAFNRAMFDPADGHLLDYLRSVSATRQRVHIQVKRLDPKAPSQ